MRLKLFRKSQMNWLPLTMVSLPIFSFVESMGAWGVEVHDVLFLVREN